jgi:hypothetical protein
MQTKLPFGHNHAAESMLAMLGGSDECIGTKGEPSCTCVLSGFFFTVRSTCGHPPWCTMVSVFVAQLAASWCAWQAEPSLLRESPP